MLGFPIALVYANAAEWWIHKHVLHGPGKKKGSFWSFHFHDHHHAARRHDMVDSSYERFRFTWSPQTRETVCSPWPVHTPLAPLAAGFVAGVWCSPHGRSLRLAADLSGPGRRTNP